MQQRYTKIEGQKETGQKETGQKETVTEPASWVSGGIVIDTSMELSDNKPTEQPSGVSVGEVQDTDAKESLVHQTGASCTQEIDSEQAEELSKTTS
jgi:hypothetical protein